MTQRTSATGSADLQQPRDYAGACPIYTRLAADGMCDLPDADGVLNGGPSPNGWSRQGDIWPCPQKYAFSNLFGDPETREYDRPLEDPLVRGTLVHVGMEHYWTQRLVAHHGGDASGLLDPLVAIRRFAERADHDRRMHGASDGWAEHVDRAQNVMRLYVRHNPHRHIEPVAVEHVVCLWFDDNGEETAPPPDAEQRLALARKRDYGRLYLMGAPWLSTFRVDLLGKGVDGKLLVIDWKTAYRVNATKRDGFLLAGQMLQYWWWAATRHQQDLGGVYVGLVDFTAAAKADPGKTFILHGLPLQEAAVRRFGRAVRDRGQMLHLLLSSGRDVEDWPRAFVEQGPCTDRYGMCPHRRWCGEGVPHDYSRWSLATGRIE